jgi:hypothetical protein
VKLIISTKKATNKKVCMNGGRVAAAVALVTNWVSLERRKRGGQFGAKMELFETVSR